MPCTVNIVLYKQFFLFFPFSDDLSEKEVDIKLEISKKAGLLNKAVKFDDVPCKIDQVCKNQIRLVRPFFDIYFFVQEIPPNPALFDDYIDRNPVHRSVQVSGDMAENEVSTTIYIYLRKSHASRRRFHEEKARPPSLSLTYIDFLFLGLRQSSARINIVCSCRRTVLCTLKRSPPS